MIQNYNLLSLQVQKINDIVDNKVFIQKIYSTSFYISITLRFVGETKFLTIGRGSGLEGVWLGENRVQAPLRKIDKLLEYMRKHLGGSTFLGLEIDEEDRIFSIKYQKWGHENRFTFFYRARNLYFLNHYFCPNKREIKTFRSWERGQLDDTEFSYDLFDEIGRITLGKTDEASKLICIEQLLADEMKKAYGGSEKTKIKFLRRKISKIKEDLEKVRERTKLTELIESCVDFSVMPPKNKIGKIKLNFKEATHYKRRDEVYLKIKKLKKAESILLLRNEDALEKLEKVKKSDIGENRLKTVTPVWHLKKIKMITEVKVKSEKAYKIFEFDGFRAGVGTTAKGNDGLRKEWAHKNDTWFHMEGDKSAHVILKLDTKMLDENLFRIVAGIILDYTKRSTDEAALIFTQVKNLKGVRGVTGSVTVKNPKYITALSNSNWKDLII